MSIKSKYVEMQKELLKDIISSFEGKYKVTFYDDNYTRFTFVTFKDFKITNTGKLYVLFTFKHKDSENDCISYTRSESAENILMEKTTPDTLIWSGRKIYDNQ